MRETMVRTIVVVGALVCFALGASAAVGAAQASATGADQCGTAMHDPHNKNVHLDHNRLRLVSSNWTSTLHTAANPIVHRAGPRS